MKFTLVTLSNALLVGTAFAGVAQRMERRAARDRRTNPLIPATSTSDGPLAANKSNVQYSSNWAGAVLTAPPSGTTFTSVSASFTVPQPSGSGASSAWVGIDGDTATNSILQTGLDFNSNSDGSYSYDCWYEWYPDYAYDFDASQIGFSPGDSVTLNVYSTSTTTGVATIENLSTGQTVTQNLQNSAALAGQNAEWIVEDFESGGSLVAFNDFGTVDFTGASAGLSDGSSVGTDGATILDIQQSGQTLTDAEVPSSSEVTVKYV